MDEPATTKNACLAYLEERISSADEDSAGYEIGTLIKNFIIDDALSASETAQRIDSYYTDRHLPADPLRRLSEDKGISSFLAVLWDFVCNMARLVPYNDIRQEKLIHLMLELRKIHRPAWIWNEDCLAYNDDNVYAGMMDDEWNDLYVYDDQEKDDEAISGPLKQRCEEWVNFSTFMARTIGAGMNDKAKSGYKYPLIDIPEFTEKDLPPGPIRNLRIKVATQYILLAGPGIYREIAGQYPEDSDDRQEGQETWESWMEKFQDVAEGEKEESELRSGASQAHQIMMDLHSKEVTVDSGKGAEEDGLANRA